MTEVGVTYHVDERGLGMGTFTMVSLICYQIAAHIYQERICIYQMKLVVIEIKKFLHI